MKEEQVLGLMAQHGGTGTAGVLQELHVHSHHRSRHRRHLCCNVEGSLGPSHSREVDVKSGGCRQWQLLAKSLISLAKMGWRGGLLPGVGKEETAVVGGHKAAMQECSAGSR